MKDWRKTIVAPDISIKDALRVIDSGSLRVALVLQEETLCGVVTDGDVRRGILRGIGLEEPVQEIMNHIPVVAHVNNTESEIFNMMKEKKLFHIPIVDDNNKLLGIKIIEELLTPKKIDNRVVLMAGGLGTRLMPLTDNCPKPMLMVGDKPILETILLQFIYFGFHRFSISVNYKSEMIVEYFGDGSKWGVEIEYIYENKRMGTAGALSLLSEQPKEPIIVMNGDLLTKTNFKLLLDYHNSNGAKATLAVREFDYQIPYGVVQVNDTQLVNIEEKPIQKSFVSAGIYVIGTEALQLIPEDVFYDMPSLFDNLLANGSSTTVFPIREYWLDIGRMDDFEKANEEYVSYFK